MKENNKGIIHLLPLLLAGLIIVAVGAGMWWYGKQTGQEIISKATPGPEVNISSPIPEKSESETIKWEASIDENYSFNYPSIYSLKKNGDKYLLMENLEDPESIALFILVLPGYLKPEDFREVKAMVESGVAEKLGAVFYEDTQNRKWMISDTDKTLMSNSPEVEASILTEDDQITIVFHINNSIIDKSFSNYRELVNLILDSFEFVE